MNLIDTFQDLVANVPDLVQPLIVAAAAAIPFVEGEGAATIGILGGMNPVLAAVAAVIGNFVCVTVLVLLAARTRSAVVTAHRARRMVAAGAPDRLDAPVDEPVGLEAGDRGAARRVKFQRAFERYGVPGVSLLGPLLLPTQFTATMLAGAGVGVARILVWQAVAIVGWTTLLTLVVTGVLSVAG